MVYICIYMTHGVTTDHAGGQIGAGWRSSPGLCGFHSHFRSRALLNWSAPSLFCQVFISLCLQCQHAKVHRHTKAPLEPFLISGKCFDHVHVDLVGPLPQSHGFAHLLTVVDYTTRWLEGVPLVSTTTVVVARAFLST